MKKKKVNGYKTGTGAGPLIFLLAAFLCTGCSQPGDGPGGPLPVTSAPEGFVEVPGKTVTGSASNAMTVTVPNDSAYTNPGRTSTHTGVFVQGRKLTIASFYMAKFETTRGLWHEVREWAAGNGYTFQHPLSAPPAADQQNRPVTGVNWRDAVVWCNAYSEKSGLEPVYYAQNAVLKDSRDSNAAACDAARWDKNKNGFRLPTEAEREFAARGGDPAAADWNYLYAGSDDVDAVAWHYGNSGNSPQNVGGKAPNRLGIYDLSGNAQEWCWDWMRYDIDPAAATPADGAAYNSSTANQKPFPGGGARSNSTMSCVAYRWGFSPDYQDGGIGFRVARKQ